MKRLFLMVMLLIMIALPAFAADEICGKEFKISVDYELYILKSEMNNPSLPCTSGTVWMYWQNKFATYSFSVYDTYFVDIYMIQGGKSVLTNFVYRDHKLTYQDPASLTFSEY